MNPMYRDGGDRIRIVVDSDLEDLIPGYLANRRRDVDALHRALRAGDFETVRTLAHSMKGTGGGYGFDHITELGAALEQAAGARAVSEIGRQIVALEEYLARVEICYE